jgi:23S rRNA (uracil1939-C5)-methyltransferase
MTTDHQRKTIQGVVESIAFGGEGVLRHDRHVIFIPFSAPQDHLTIAITEEKKRFARGVIAHIDRKSPLRTTPHCPHFGICGGCQFQHLAYAAQLETKRTFIQDALLRIGKLNLTVPPIIPSPSEWGYRQHIRLQLRPKNDGFEAGYIGNDNHSFVPISQCPIFHDSSLLPLQRLVHSLSSEEIERGSVRLIKSDCDTLILAFDFFPNLPHNHIQCNQPSFPYSGMLFRSPQETISYGNTTCSLEMLGLQMRFSPYGFVQNHLEQSTKLYSAILDAVSSSCRQVLDLYCGIGATSLLIAQRGTHVIGIESHAETIKLAQENSEINQIPSVRFLKGKAEIEGVQLLKKLLPDVVLCNPPRTGLDPLLTRAFLEHRPATLLYVSCMPATLARDLRLLVEGGGYCIASIQGFDLFPQTTHVETLVVLKQKTTERISVVS